MIEIRIISTQSKIFCEIFIAQLKTSFFPRAILNAISGFKFNSPVEGCETEFPKKLSFIQKQVSMKRLLKKTCFNVIYFEKRCC